MGLEKDKATIFLWKKKKRKKEIMGKICVFLERERERERGLRYES